ncbi:unnamed protein product [Enterobius vermicularis]|uniref:Copper transport protein n=1 Tax=Enterobius vermicularis TaxID=51028 RepID=A0A0N4VC41_ENTVE|nr:unnamed protein product [Enterobius vermicularis]
MTNSTDLLVDDGNFTLRSETVNAVTDAAKNFLANRSMQARNSASHAGHDSQMHHMHHHHHHQHMGMGEEMGMMTGDTMSSSNHQMMKMWFHGGYDEVILFDFWRINSFCGLITSCLVIFVMSALYEGVKWFRVYLQMASEKVDSQNCLLEERHHNGLVYKPTTTTSNNVTAGFQVRGFQGVLYAVQLTLAYWMMLVAMTFNSYLTIAVIVGAAFGHWLFAVLKCFNSQADRLNSLATDACH